MNCRVLPHSVGDGPANMALDEALLDSVDADPTSAVLRTYAWSEPTLSLGYFQRLDEALADPRWRDVPLVRRPSGGGAIWHDREITYALILPRIGRFAGKAADIYKAVHDAIRVGLHQLGFAVERRGTAPSPPSVRPFLCFLDHDPEDLVLGAAKVVGGAQRRRPRAVLQHGSVLLAPSRLAPELPGLDLVSPVASGRADWLQASLIAGLGLQSCDDAIRPRERARADRLEREVYRTEGWTGRC